MEIKKVEKKLSTFGADTAIREVGYSTTLSGNK